jgi:K+-transporting ATPase ATPase C chain
MFVSSLRAALVMSVIFMLITGVAYPLLITGIAQAVFPEQANGSIVRREGAPVGSSLIGQDFSEPQYFWGRLSATGTTPYNPLASGGSNQGPLNPALLDAVRGRMSALRQLDPQNNAPVPVDLVTASASGLDPHISIAAARYQAARVARVRLLPASTVLTLIDKHVHWPAFGLFGEPHVNVLELNLALADLAM